MPECIDCALLANPQEYGGNNTRGARRPMHTDTRRLGQMAAVTRCPWRQHTKGSTTVKNITLLSVVGALTCLLGSALPITASSPSGARAEAKTFACPTMVAAGPTPVNLRHAASLAILAKSGISTTGTTTVFGNLGVSPIAASAITGFGLVLDSSNTFSKSARVTGRVFAANYASPTPARLTEAVNDMQTAYTDAAGRAPNVTELGAGLIGGLTILPGVYKWSSNVRIGTDVTLMGGIDSVWIFQIAGTLGISSGKKVRLAGGARAKNIFWQVAGVTNLGTASVFNGTILNKKAVTMQSGAKLNGRALSQTAVTLIANTVTNVQ